MKPPPGKPPIPSMLPPIGMSNGARHNGIGMTSARTRERLVQRLRDQGIANPLASILTAGMMLDFFNEKTAAGLLNRAVAQVLAEGKVRTPDMGGHASTRQVGDEVIRTIQAL